MHRVGRTARIGAVGKAMLFLNPHEVGFVERLEAAGALAKETGFDALTYQGLKGLPKEPICPEDLRSASASPHSDFR